MAFDLTAAVTHKRSVARMLMPNDWRIEGQQVVDDGGGGYETTWGTIAEGRAAQGQGCRLLEAGYQAREQIMAERPAAIGAFFIALPHGTEVSPSARIVIGSRTFYAVGIPAGATDAWALYVQVPAAEVI